MDLIGIEPMTSSMPWKRAPSCATGPLFGKTTPLSSLAPTFESSALKPVMPADTSKDAPGKLDVG